jgi:hypothetical protein
MALQALSNTEHGRLLQRSHDIPYEQSKELRALLNQFFEEYHTLLVDLADVIQKYREIAAKINERQPLVKRKEPQQRAS